MRFVSIIRSLIIAAAFVGTASGASAQAAPGRVAYITARAVLQETPGYAAAESLWVREIDGFRDEITRLQTTLDSAATKFEESSVMLSATKRNDERRKLVDQQAGLQRREQELQQRAAARRQELVAPFEQRVTQMIEAVRKEGNYALVFDVSGQANQIVAADLTLDLTQRVIERIKQSAPAASGGAPRND
ncbi:MAG: OmpH family outer membrane protein [Gemmatimonadales bacterium]